MQKARAWGRVDLVRVGIGYELTGYPIGVKLRSFSVGLGVGLGFICINLRWNICTSSDQHLRILPPAVISSVMVIGNCRCICVRPSQLSVIFHPCGRINEKPAVDEKYMKIRYNGAIFQSCCVVINSADSLSSATVLISV